MEVVIVCIVLGYVFGCIVGFIGGRFVQKKDVEKFKSDYHKLCELKDIRIQKLESENRRLDQLYTLAKDVVKQFLNDCVVTNDVLDKIEPLIKEMKIEY